MIYLLPEMIGLACKKFPTKAHKRVAQRIAISNPNVSRLDIMVAIVKAINAVPNKRIKKVTYNELVNEFNMPDVGIPVCD